MSGRQSGGPEYALHDDLDTSEYEDTTLALGWQADFNDTWRSTLTATRFDPSFARNGLEPVVFLTFRCFGAEVEVDGPVVVNPVTSAPPGPPAQAAIRTEGRAPAMAFTRAVICK